MIGCELEGCRFEKSRFGLQRDAELEGLSTGREGRVSLLSCLYAALDSYSNNSLYLSGRRSCLFGRRTDSKGVLWRVD